MSLILLFKLLGLLSLFTFIGSLIAVPWLIGRMRVDYFLTHRREVEIRHRRNPGLALIIFVLRNGGGLILILGGVAMLFLPGQGLLTILIGICIMDFPGKRSLLDRLSRIPQIRKGLNWIRRKQGKVEFVFAENRG